MIKEYIKENQDRILEELFSLIRIPSVSAQPDKHGADMVRCAERWKELLLMAGVDRAEVMPTDGNPVVYGEKIVDPAARTVLIYGHYDVMPAEPFELWKTEPFEPVIKDGRLWGRGADDDKGQSFIQAKAFEYIVKHNLLKHNIKFILEGEEEIGSPSLGAFCEKHKDLLKCDVILVSDTSMIAKDIPSLTVGLRGLAYWQIEVTGPNHDLHSGHFGGAVANPINVLCKLITDVTDKDGRIQFPGFYDDVEEVSPEERAMVAQIPFDETAYKKSLDVDELFGEKGYNTIEHTGVPPKLRCLRHLVWLSGRRSQDRNPLKGVCEALMPPCPASGSQENRADGGRLFPASSTQNRESKGRIVARRTRLCVPNRPPGLQSSRARVRKSIR